MSAATKINSEKGLKIWDKIKALEQEYERLSDKAYEIEQDKKAISFLIQKYLTQLK